MTNGTPDTLARLYQLVLDRRKADPETSYIAKRLRQGTAKIAQKMGEEAVETVIAAIQKDKKEVVAESADMLFHWLMLLADVGATPQEVMEELSRREGISGLDEKAHRKARRKGDI